ncbi:MAG: SURF1 family protein [Gammaproteobacteria bacterium]
MRTLRSWIGTELMRIGRYEFVPNRGPALLTLLVFPLLLALGFWQLDRADQKLQLQDEFQARYQAERVDLNAFVEIPEDMFWRPVRAAGRYLPLRYLLDNQVVKREAGYKIYAVLDLSGKPECLLVEQGWVPAGSDRRLPPDLEAAVSAADIQGRAIPEPATGILLAEHRLEPLTEKLFRAQRIDTTELSQHSGCKLLPFLLQPGSTSQADPLAGMPGIGRERHLGYAFQWFALAATLLVIFIVVNTRKTAEKTKTQAIKSENEKHNG